MQGKTRAVPSSFPLTYEALSALEAMPEQAELLGISLCWEAIGDG
jgi:hypothetical protein